MRKASMIGLAAVSLAAFTAPAQAAVVFSDDFSSDAPQQIGANTLNNFDVSGTVDVVGSGNFGITCAGGSGFCIDIDGTPGPGGLTVNQTFAYSLGDIVTLSYMVSGNQRGGAADSFNAFLSGNGVSTAQGLALSPFTGFQNQMLTFTATSNGFATFGFSSTSADNVGPILDNVSLDISSGMGAVPEPSTWLTMLLGFGLMGGFMRSRRRKTAAASAFA